MEIILNIESRSVCKVFCVLSLLKLALVQIYKFKISNFRKSFPKCSHFKWPYFINTKGNVCRSPTKLRKNINVIFLTG